MAGPSSATSGAIAIDDSTVTGIGDFDNGSKSYEPVGAVTLAASDTFNYNSGTNGTRSRRKEAVVKTARAVGGNIPLEPTPVELDLWLPRILGTAESADSFVLGETVPEFGVLVDKVAKRHIYTGCKVNSATFSSSQGQPLGLSVDVIGKDEVESATAFPGTIPAIDGGRPYTHTQCTFQLAADTSAVNVQSMTLRIENFLSADFFNNSVTVQDLIALDRLITLSMVIPYNADSIDLHNQAVDGAGGTLTFTNGGQSTLFTFANLKAPANSPPLPPRGSILYLTVNMTAFMSGSTKELVVTHDSTA